MITLERTPTLITNPFNLRPESTVGIELAHPDDEFFLAHGIRSLASLAINGSISGVHVHIASVGEASTLGDNRNRPSEALVSLGYLGIDVSQIRFGHRPDGQLASDIGLDETTHTFIVTNGITDMITLGNPDYHPDHSATTKSALNVAGNGVRVWALNNEGAGDIAIYGELRHKLEVMRQHPSQFSARLGFGETPGDSEQIIDGYVVDEYTARVLEMYNTYLRRETYDLVKDA